MLLTIDIGNTNVTLGLYEGNILGSHWRLATDHARMPDYYRAADCMLLTSDSEGSPNVVKEALACGVPVVSVDAGDVRFWLDRVPGCVVAERDPAALAAALECVLDGPGSVDASSVLPELDRANAARRLLAVYHSVRQRSR